MSKWSDAACDRLLRDVLEPLALGETVSIDKCGRYTIVGFELGGEAVVLDDGQERFTVYAWRVSRRDTKAGV